MRNNKFETEIKAGVKSIGKFVDKINPNTDYQAKVKNDIEYINHELESNNIEEFVNCNKIISAIYANLLVDRGFSLMNECEIRERGYDWNYKNLEKIRNVLQNELLIGAAFSSFREVLPEYVAEKMFGEK